jgi:ElaB/YqjD/DUF883 family membrane-anchored ribosome-binding protein
MNDDRTDETPRPQQPGLAGEAKRHIAGAVRETTDQAREAAEEVKDTAESLAESASDEIAKLREKVESLLKDRVTPAIANAAEAAGVYARDAKAAVAGQAERAAGTVKEHPLLAVAAIAALGFALGRLTAPTYHPYRR